jgi:hypothetical protein
MTKPSPDWYGGDLDEDGRTSLVKGNKQINFSLSLFMAWTHYRPPWRFGETTISTACVGC